MTGTELELFGVKARLVAAEAERDGFVVEYDVPSGMFVLDDPAGMNQYRISAEFMVDHFDHNGPVKGWRMLRAVLPRLSHGKVKP